MQLTIKESSNRNADPAGPGALLFCQCGASIPAPPGATAGTSFTCKNCTAAQAEAAAARRAELLRRQWLRGKTAHAEVAASD